MNWRKMSALFLSSWGCRISRNGVYRAVTEAAAREGLHNPESKRLEDHFSPHACRHWHCTHLFRAGMKREYIKEQRGDSRKETSDLVQSHRYEGAERAYLACIQQLGALAVFSIERNPL